MLPADELEAQQRLPGSAIMIGNIYSFGILAAVWPFQVSPKSVTLRARILLV
jgi:hypothetical protein